MDVVDDPLTPKIKTPCSRTSGYSMHETHDKEYHKIEKLTLSFFVPLFPLFPIAVLFISEDRLSCFFFLSRESYTLKVQYY